LFPAKGMWYLSRVPRVHGRTAARRAGRRGPPLEQIALDFGPERPRWSFSRLVVASPHRERIRERIEFVRRFFPELDGTTIRVGLAKRRGVLGWGSLDPEHPGIWVRPRLLHHFTIAHELTHLLQARGLVPRGERACDLWALARSPLVVDSAPGYLRMPRGLRTGRLEAWHSTLLSDAARRAVAARLSGDRRYLQRFEREIAEAVGRRGTPPFTRVRLKPAGPDAMLFPAGRVEA
jgi:hypothetical protein